MNGRFALLELNVSLAVLQCLTKHSALMLLTIRCLAVKRSKGIESNHILSSPFMPVCFFLHLWNRSSITKVWAGVPGSLGLGTNSARWVSREEIQCKMSFVSLRCPLQACQEYRKKSNRFSYNLCKSWIPTSKWKSFADKYQKWIKAHFQRWIISHFLNYKNIKEWDDKRSCIGLQDTLAPNSTRCELPKNPWIH